MVTHSMQQAAYLGDRLVMMHRGRVIHDDAGVHKRAFAPTICSPVSRRFAAANWWMRMLPQ